MTFSVEPCCERSVEQRDDADREWRRHLVDDRAEPGGIELPDRDIEARAALLHPDDAGPRDRPVLGESIEPIHGGGCSRADDTAATVRQAAVQREAAHVGPHHREPDEAREPDTHVLARPRSVLLEQTPGAAA